MTEGVYPLHLDTERGSVMVVPAHPYVAPLFEYPFLLPVFQLNENVVCCSKLFACEHRTWSAVVKFKSSPTIQQANESSRQDQNPAVLCGFEVRVRGLALEQE